jgi:glycine betaine/proline transport system ATP-binding protein
VVAIELKSVDIIFGKHPKQALSLLDQGASRDEILSKTGQILGAAEASIAIKKGEVCVLMGLSGSGKSTLLRAINGLNTVTRGQVLVDYNGQQVDVAHCDARTLRELRMHKVAMVFQQFALLPWRTVHENVGLGLELRGMPRAERDAIVREKLEVVDRRPPPTFAVKDGVDLVHFPQLDVDDLQRSFDQGLGHGGPASDLRERLGHCSDLSY